VDQVGVDAQGDPAAGVLGAGVDELAGDGDVARGVDRAVDLVPGDEPVGRRSGRGGGPAGRAPAVRSRARWMVVIGEGSVLRCASSMARWTVVVSHQSVTGGPARWVPSQPELLTADPEVPARGHYPVDLDRIS
jgi:hypothetical protein